MKLRDYQEKAVAAVIESWKTHRSCVVVLPTGCGKTVVFGDVVRRRLGEATSSSPNGEATSSSPNGEATSSSPNGEATSSSLQKKELQNSIRSDGDVASPGKDVASPGKDVASPGKGNRAMVLAHREELIDQAAAKIGAITGERVDIEMGDRAVEDTEGLFGEHPARVVVSSVQTQNTGRMGKFLPEEFATLVIDEAHHATSPSYRACIEHYFENPDCRLLGVTATPDRADETALGLVFDHVAFEYTVSDAIRDGWLVPVKQKLVTVRSLDFSQVKTTAGDLNQGELADVMQEEENLHAVAGPTIEICGKRRAIVFAVSVKQAERLAEIINRHKETGQAAWVCGKTPKVERQRILTDFREGKLQYVVNVGVLTEGFDDAGVEVIVMARPTKSRALYAQMAGRATRPAAEIAGLLGEATSSSLQEKELEDSIRSDGDVASPGKDAASPGKDAAALRREMIARSSKPCCLIVDFVGNSGRHKLMTTLDILGGKTDIDDPDEAEARRLVHEKCAEAEGEVDTMEELEKAREEIRKRKLIDAARRAFIKAKAAYSVQSIDPFDIYDLAPVTAQERQTNCIRLSEKQKALLKYKMKVDPNAVSSSEGRALLDEFFWRINHRMPTLKQAKFLRRNGFPAPMTFDEASRTIDWIMRERSR